MDWKRGVAAFVVVVAACAVGCGPDEASPSSAAPPPVPAAGAQPSEPPAVARVERELPSSAPLTLAHAFGSEIMVPGAYGDPAAQAADRRDGALEVEVVDAVDETPLAGARVTCRGSDAGEDLTLQTDDRGIARFEAAPAVWLGVVAHDGAKDTFARRHDMAWKLVHGPGRVRLALPRTNWFRFRFDLPDRAEPPERFSVQYERQGSEGLRSVVPSLAGHWNLGDDRPCAIALPTGPCRVRFDFGASHDLPGVLLTDVVPGAGERAIDLRERVSVSGTVIGDTFARGSGTLFPGAEIEIELRRRHGGSAVESVRFGHDGTVRRVWPHGDGSYNSHPPLASANRTNPNGPWSFCSPRFAPGAKFDVIARAYSDGEVVGCGRSVGVVAGGRDVAVVLLPAATISGTVCDAEGNPLTTPVVVTATWACEAVSPKAVLASTTSRDDGTFELTGLPRVPVRVQAGGAFLPVYTPKPVEVIAGDGAVVTLATRPTLSLRGVVRDAASGRTVACHLEMHQATSADGGHGIVTHADGRWLMPGLVPGELRLVLQIGAERVGELEPVTITETTTDISLRLP
jgi:hypothetical protein